jgi:predicted DNA-binding transcriptional regulator AlpA
MSKAAKPEDLVNATQIAQMLEVSVPAVSNYQVRDYLEFPKPWGIWPGRMGLPLPNGSGSRPIKLWLKSDIEAWAEKRGDMSVMGRKMLRIKLLKEKVEKLEQEIKDESRKIR